MRSLINRIKFWFWWKFRATEKQKVGCDIFTYGTGIMKDGKRIDPRSFNNLDK